MKKILIVEDEILIGMMLAENIREYGFDPCEVMTTAEKAIEAVRTEKPDAVLMDISLSGDMDGIEAAAIIKAENDNIPIIFFTGYRDAQLLERARAVKPAAILDKLGPPDALRGTLESLFP